ncbi:hypothetical protein D3C74_487240 [compost metagenome]
MCNLILRQIDSLLRMLSFEKTEMEKVIAFEHNSTHATIFVSKEPLNRHIEIVKRFLLDNDIVANPELGTLISKTMESSSENS